MVEISSGLRKSVEKFLQEVKRRYNINAAYLYGSQVKGTATVWSDIDVALVSADFSNDLFEERLILMRLAALIDERIEPYPIPEAMFNKTNPLASEIQNYGVRLI
jgi:uncharacterized protein